MKKFFNPLILATALAATACTNTEDDSTDIVDPSGKTAISFVGEENHSPMTRAGFTTNTKIAMRIKSADGSDSLFTHVTATAAAQESSKDYSNVTLTDARYWDDAYGRAAKLSVYAIAVPGKEDVTNDGKGIDKKLNVVGTDTWFSEDTENETLTWKVTTDAQTEDLINAEDLTYSNNISSTGKGGAMSYNYTDNDYTTVNDHELKFRLKDASVTDGPGKFDQGHLIFNHALCRIALNLTKGAGFGDNAFEFTSGNVKIKNVPTSGTLDLATGKWTTTASDIKDINQMREVSKEEHKSYSLMAQFLPDYVINSGSDTNMLEFTIDNNTYKVTQDQMFVALNNATANKDKMTKLESDKVTMEQGINYVFNITVNKTGVSVSAKLVDFADVTGALTPSNANITLTFPAISGTDYTNFALYRSVDGTIDATAEKTDWNGDYVGPKGSDNWYFKDNLTYYHFRSVKSGTTVVTKDGETDVPDYFVIESGKQDDAHDYHWGAPMKSTPSYSTSTGYADCLYRAIGATADEIKMTDFHMMSNITINLATTTGGDAVTLAGSKITISKFNANGKVLMGSGLVEVTGTATGSLAMDGNTEGTVFTCSVVPQILARGTTDDDYVCITIETADHNKYYIFKQLSTIMDKDDNAITRWLPGRSYTYNFTLKKTGIDSVTATVQKWEDVTAKGTDISLE